MSVGSTLSLGLRLALGRGRGGLTRLMLMTVGVALGVGLVVGGLGIVPALTARQERQFARIPALSAQAMDDPSVQGGRPIPGSILWAERGDRIGDAAVTRIQVARSGRGYTPLPPGVSHFPGPGEKVVSPALAELLSTPVGRVAAERFPGRVVGTIEPAGLLHPGELVAYIGSTPKSMKRWHPLVAIGFGTDSGRQSEPIPLDAKILILIGVIGLLVPTLVFVMTSTRLSAASRERRLAAIRLVGATPAETRLMAAVESGVAAVAGSVLGVVLFFVLRPVVAGLALAGYQWFPSDMAPPVGQVVAIVLAAPALAVGAALIGLRRLIVSPLGVARRARTRRAGPVRLILPALGLAGLGVAWLLRDSVERGGAASLTLVGASFFLLLGGVAVVAPWLGAVAAPLLTRLPRGVGAMMGARRVQADPTAAGRVVGAVALLVCGAGVILALLPPALASRGGPENIAASLPDSSVAVFAFVPVEADQVARTIDRQPGVTAVAPLSELPESEVPGAGGPTLSGYTIADCRALGAVMDRPFDRCGPETVYVSTKAPMPGWVRPGTSVPAGTSDGRPVRLRVPDTVVRMDLPGELIVVLPPESVPARVRPTLTASTTLVATDGNPASVERVRNVVHARRLEGQVSTPAQSRAEAAGEVRRITSLVDLGIAVALAIALANLLVVTVDHVGERRRPLAVLVASGVPVNALRRAVAVEIGLPLATAIAMATAAAMVAATILAGVIDQPMVVPVARMTVLFGLAAGAVAVVTALTFPTLGRATRPETLHSE